MEEQLIDYLYGELDPDQRAAFERALPAHPEVAQELERHRWTRARMAELPVVPLPAGALDQAMLAAERHIKTVGPAPARPPGFFARLGKLFMQPAFATAFVAVLGVGVGFFMSRSRELPGSGPSADDQLGASITRASETVVPAVRVPEHAREADELAQGEAARDESASKLDAPARPAAPEPSPIVATPAAEPSAVMGGAAHGSGKVAEAERPRAAAAGGTPVAKPLKDQPKPTEAAADPRGATLDGLKTDPTVGFADGDGVWEDTRYQGTVTVDDAATGRAKPPASGPSATTTNTEEGAHRSPPAPEVRADSEVREVQTLAAAERETKKVSIDDDAKPKASEPPRLNTEKAPATSPTPSDGSGDRKSTTAPAPTTPDPTKTPSRAADKSEERVETKTAAPSEDKLWTTYQQQIAAGAFADANKTLADLLKLTGDTAKLKAARADLSKREAESRRGEATKPAEKLPPDPSGPTPGRSP